MKKLICLLLALILLPSLLSACTNAQLATPVREDDYVIDVNGFVPAEDSYDMVQISENKSFILYACLRDGTACVYEKATGKTYYTNPSDRSSDAIATGFHKNALQSAITVVYDTAQSQEMTCGSLMSCVNKDGLLYQLPGDGSVVFLFYFPNEGFSIPVRYSITQECFKAAILTDYIAEYDTNSIKSIDLLPFFGAGSSADTGYMLVPDGCGALIYFNNNNLTAATYSKQLYGFDNGTSDKMMGGKASGGFFTVSENQYMPVFGNSCNDGGFFAIITKGAARATVSANVSGKYTQYNTVWSRCAYRTGGTVRQTQKDGSDLAVDIAEKKTEIWCNYEVSYYLLSDGSNTYADMAGLYRDYLLQNGGLSERVQVQENIPLYLDLYGYIEKTKSVLGIPADKKISMTTVEDVNALLDELSLSDISNVVVKYNYWAKNSYFGKIPTTATVDGKVGTAAQMQALKTRLEEAGGALYLSGDLLNVYKTGNGVSRYNDVLQSVANTAQRQYVFALDSAMADSRYDAWYLLRPSSMQRFFTAFIEALHTAGYDAVALDSVGTMLYSELSSDGVGRNQVLEIVRELMADAAEQTDGILLEGANDYAAAYATHLLNTSFRSSGYDLEDASVPFYQMVFHGYVSYSIGASNLSSDSARQTLTCMEYGAYPLFSLVGRNADELIGSRLDRLYSADAANWMDFAAEQYRQIDSVLRDVQDCVITAHEILSEDVRAVTYANGVRIVVNYGAMEQTVDGACVAPMGYAVLRDGAVVTSGVAAGMQ